MDAATGMTLWKAIFAGKGLYQWGHKGGPTNNTPCVADGRVFAMGSGGCLYALDASTGKSLWQAPGVAAEKPGGRNLCNAPIYAGGVLIVGDHVSALMGFEPATGKPLWKLPGKNHRFQVPARWVARDGQYVISLTAPDPKGQSEAVCIEPQTGKIRWSIPLPNSGKGVSVHGDVFVALIDMVVAEGTGGNAVSKARCVAYRMSPEKAEPLWSAPCHYICTHLVPAVNGKVVVLGGLAESRMLDLATGKELAVYKGKGPNNEGHVMLVDNLALLSLDGSHGHCEMVVLGATPETFKLLCEWNPPHPHTTSYHNKFMTWPAVEGRIFMRGHDGVYCYDLRNVTATQ
jgi:outer membrane protein assembly factor BamB